MCFPQRVPELETPLHLNMLRAFRRSRIDIGTAAARGYASRRELALAIEAGKLRAETGSDGPPLVFLEDLEQLFGQPRGGAYGMDWGDPELVEPLAFIKRRYVLPLVKPEYTGVEIGPGGGRWTTYLKAMQRLYVVDLHQEMLDELRRRFDQPSIVPIRNNGDDFPGISDAEVDLLFSFDVFVHFELPHIEAYLRNMRRILKPTGRAFIHYSDKTKIMAAVNRGFGVNDPVAMRELVTRCGYFVLQEDTTTMWHSSIIIFSPRPPETLP